MSRAELHEFRLAARENGYDEINANVGEDIGC